MDFMNSHTIESVGMEYIFNMISPKSPYGLESKRSMTAYKRGDESKLQEELDNTEKLIELIRKYPVEFNKIKFILMNFKEIKTSLKRVENSISIDEVELFEIKNFILNIKDINIVQKRLPSIPEKLNPCRNFELEELFDPEGRDNRTFYIYDCYSEELRYIREEKRRLQGLYDGERKRLMKLVEGIIGLPLRISGEVMVHKSDKDTLEKAMNCPYLLEDSSTILSLTFRLKKSDDINRLLDEIEDLKLKEEQEEYIVRRNLSLEIKKNIDSINEQISHIAYLDLLLSKAEFALEINGTKPVIGEDLCFVLKGGRHLKLDQILKSQDKQFIPLNCSLKSGVTIITGANMGGKTVRLQLLGMLQAIAQFGLYVPAESFKTCIMDFIYFSIGDMQSIDSGLSTFGGEISGMIDIMNLRQYRGLILVDELARGTNPEEGYAISRAIVRYLKDKSSITLFTTHFSGITNEEGIEHLRVKGLKRIDFNELKRELESKNVGMEQVQDYMDFTLERVEGDYDVPRDAINIARLMGLDETILNWAEEILVSGRENNYEQVKFRSELNS
ncbi:MAG: mismatch repair protein MutS [Clostridiales bacterium]|jgi:DNA mismatch repair ATPase MutS|nr:mismatch repair protein MutS [Clostridiales bacterium]